MSPAVSVLHERAERYVAMRRSLGYKFISQARMLAGFADYLAARGDTTVTVTAALAWATAPDPASAAYHRQRLSVVRGFARHLAAFDPSCQVPPPACCRPPRYLRPTCTRRRRSARSFTRPGLWRSPFRRPPATPSSVFWR